MTSFSFFSLISWFFWQFPDGAWVVRTTKKTMSPFWRFYCPPQKKDLLLRRRWTAVKKAQAEANPKLGVKLRSGPIKLRKTSLIPCLFLSCVLFSSGLLSLSPVWGNWGQVAWAVWATLPIALQIFTGYWCPEIAALKRIVYSQPGFFSSALQMWLSSSLSLTKWMVLSEGRR
jgi:hypothetical protein